MNLYVVRHGQVPSNVNKIISGWNDEELTNKGIEQAKNIKEKLEKITFNGVYCSPIKRAKQTADIIVPDKEIIYDERLVERNPGEMLGHKRSEIDKKEWNSLSKEYTELRAETLLAGIIRTKNFLYDLNKVYNDENILIVTHNFISKCIWLIANNIYDKNEISKSWKDIKL